MTIYLKKTIFTFVKQISLTLLNSSGGEIAVVESNFKLSDLWKERNISFSGEIKEQTEFKSIKINVTGFSFREKFSILYGDNTASFIHFDFTNS